ncbi:hypothetical protein LGV61_12855 [Desulfurispirillum indicum]|uniref:hypothetical protein n=1 Tax=Desulfurispirillum indicum TaxID=936456 RepID=UPI001CF9A888|nr:hypothetical protein [Desulfurispirillum indicum]UCZ56600.1 hypothetical protein LGV61_12855 [Desulfurispirillum indicum]
MAVLRSKPKKYSWIGKILLVLLLATAAALFTTQHHELALQYSGLQQVSQHNQEYLQSAFERSLKTFAVLSTIKVGLSIVEGSTIGVGFGLQVGDVVQAAYDYVDIAWKTVLAGGIILLALQYLLAMAEAAAPWLLSITFALLSLTVICRWLAPHNAALGRIMHAVSAFMVVLSISMALILPLSVTGASMLSSHITAPSLNSAQGVFDTIEQDLFRDSAEEKSIWSRWNDTRERLNKVSVYLEQKTGELVTSGMMLMAAYLFDCIVFPLLLFFLLLWFTRAVTRAFLP